MQSPPFPSTNHLAPRYAIPSIPQHKSFSSSLCNPLHSQLPSFYHTVLNILITTKNFTMCQDLMYIMRSHWITIFTYLKNVVLSWPEDGRLTAETCRQV